MDRRSSEIPNATHHPFNDGPRKLPAPASPRTMFFLLLPAGTWVANVMGAFMASSAGRDAHDIGSMCFIGTLLPIAPFCLVIAIMQASRKRNGWSSFCKGLAWNVLLVAAVWAIMTIAVQNAKKSKAENNQTSTSIGTKRGHDSNAWSS